MVFAGLKCSQVSLQPWAKHYLLFDAVVVVSDWSVSVMAVSRRACDTAVGRW